jgi:leucyl aminopeptidase
MEIITHKGLNKDADVLVIGLFEEDKTAYDNLDIKEAITSKRFTKKFGQLFSFSHKDFKKAVVVGLGKKEEFSVEKLRRAITKGYKYTKSSKRSSFTTNLLSYTKGTFTLLELSQAATEALILTSYKFDKYLNKDEDSPEFHVETIYLDLEDKEIDSGIKIGSIIAKATNFSRNLVNEPPGIGTPSFIESAAKTLTKTKNVTVEILEQSDMEKLGMGALLGVTKGSKEPPKFIILKYNGAGSEPYTAIVGKGITFDTGGYNLKPSRSMDTMKCDMSGAAAVLGTIKSISELELKKNVYGIAPCCENRVSSAAYLPSDILTAYNKKTIEIGNTDAEGRLILADALSYTEEKLKPAVIIDMATLTGACVVALGERTAAVLSKDSELISQLLLAGEKSHDRLWELPLLDDYQDCMKGSISDLRNIAPSGHGAGTITAGIFLSHFVKNAKWAHLDIAGTAFLSNEQEYLIKGGSGAGVRLLSYYFMST